jgi:hypothetical protein
VETYEIKQRQTGEILCQGSAEECADFLGTGARYIRALARKETGHKTETKFAAYEVKAQFQLTSRGRGGAHKKDIICCDCGVLMVDASAHRKRCPECARKHALEEKKRHMRAVRQTGLVTKTRIPVEINPYCKGCIHYRGMFATDICCNYYFDTDKRRPCPFGEGCTVKQTRKNRKDENKC